MIDRSGIRKILVIKLRAIGDVLLSTVITKNLRVAFPKAKIDFLTETKAKDILKGNPYIDELIVFDRKKDGIKFLINLRKRKYDLVFDLFCNPRSALMTYITGAKYRVGYAFRGRSYAYNIKLKPPNETQHNIEFNLNALKAVGIEIIDKKTYLPIFPEDEKFADRFWDENNLDGELVIALCPTGTWETKRWKLDKFAKLGDMLCEKLNAKILILWGTKKEFEDAKTIASMMKHEAIIIPPTTIKQLGAILKRCSLTVSNDSAPMHISATVGTPTLGIYGPTNPYAQGPYGEKNLWVRKEELECIACNLTKCPIGNICMEELSVETVFKAVLKLAEKNKIFQ